MTATLRSLVLLGALVVGCGGDDRPAAPTHAYAPRLPAAPAAIAKALRGGGSFIQKLPARRIGTARVHRASATVLQEPPYPASGLHGGHVVVLWSEAGHGYLVSVHGERLSRQKLVSIALVIARSTRR